MLNPRGGGFAIPAEARRERLQEEAEGVRNNGRKADRNAEETGRNDLPAGVGEPRFFHLCFNGLKYCSGIGGGSLG